MKKLALGLLAVTLLCGCGTKEAKISMEEAKEAALKAFQEISYSLIKTKMTVR